jgi:hypothetical protein
LRAALGALLYLEVRGWVNRVRTLANDPKRLIPWVIFIAWLAVTQVGQIFFLVSGRASRFGAPLYQGALLALVHAMPGLYLTVIGIILGAAKFAPADFSSPADARFLAGSPLSPRAVVLWLQLRKLLNPRLVFGILVGTAVLSFYSVPTGSALTFQVSLIAAVLGVLGLQLPLFLLRRKMPGVPWTALSWLVVLSGLAMAAIGFGQGVGFRGLPSGWVALASAPPGTLVAAAISGDLLALAGLIVIMATTVALTVFVAGDSYPELWEASRRRFALVQVVRRRGVMSGSDARRALREARADLDPNPQPPRHVVSVQGTRVPAGSMTVLWKEWLALRRRRGGVGLLVGLLLASFVAGVVAGVALAHSERTVVGVIAGVAFPFALLSAYFRVSLATDLRNPLWWLSPAGLMQRLAMWALAGILPSFVIIGAGIGAALLIANPVLALPVLAALFTFLWTMRMIGLAVYSILPSNLDMAGPGMAIRAMAMYILSAPVVLAGLIPGILSQSIIVAAACATVVAVAESIGLLVFATYRIEGNGLGFARAEAR